LWWLANHTIAAGNVLEHVTLPAQSQAYAGASVADGSPWSVAMYGTWDSATSQQYAFDSQDGRVIIGNDLTDNGFYVGDTWKDIDLFADESLHTIFVISSGSSVQAYRDNVAVGTALAKNNGLAQTGATVWRDRFAAPARLWTDDIVRAAIYDIALSTGQRAALHSRLVSG